MTESAVMEREEQNLPAERPQHPIIQKIDERMPEIAEMLPEGMNPDRFRRVVVQALVRNPDLWACTPVSVVSAIVESAQIGLEPTGVLGRAWMLPYSVKGTKEAKLIVGYRGYAELAWRADRILVTTGAVRQGDTFEYRRGTGKYLHHVPASDDPEREADDDNITDFWAMYTLPDGREDFDVMSRKAVERIRERARYKNPVWDSDFGEMGRKTVLRRLLKVAPLSPEVQRVLGRDEEIDFDTPVERVADPKRDELRDRIAQRTAAIRGESSGESEGSQVAGAGVPAGQPEEVVATARPTGLSSGGSPARAGDPWMRRLHAVASERGMDHDALHDWAVEHFGVDSLSDLSTPQRATFMELVERMPVIEQSEDRAHASDVGEGSADGLSPDIETPPGSSGPAATPEAGGSPPAASPPAASFSDPASFEVYGAAVLGWEEPQPLKDWEPAEWDQVFASLGLSDPTAYQRWYTSLERPVRAALMTAHQSPTARREAAKAAAKGKPDAEALRMGLES